MIAWLVLSILLPAPAAAQTGQKPLEGIDTGNYNYQGSLEFGYRFADSSGSASVYDTFVNLQQGPRILEQTLSMHSLNHEGVLFDDLFLSSFGWGGDPENASRLRISKNRWYNFNMSFRRDQNVWDYNLLANPLNPPNSFIQVSNTPHELLTRRRWYDYSLVLAPQSPVRLRLAYSRNTHEGPSFTSFHEGTDVLLFQNWRTTLNAYQIGVDIRVLPRTNISYDQFLQYYKGDTSWLDNNLAFQLANGTPVDAGLIYNPTANQPCSNIPTPIFDTTTTPPTLRGTCNGYLAYSRFAPSRTSYPTEQLTLQSSYFRHLDLSARVAYSSSENKISNFNELFSGLVTRTNQQFFDITGFGNRPGRSTRVVASADFGITLRISDKLRVIDNFRFSNFRIPGAWADFETTLFGTTSPADMQNPPAVFDPAVCPATPSACPQHTSSSPADISTTFFNRFLAQDAKYNTVEIEYDLSKRLGGRIGFRYGTREIRHSILASANELFLPTLPNRGDCTGLPLNPDGSCTFSGVIDEGDDVTDTHEYSGLFGIWARPTDTLRLNFDLELFSADHAPTRTTPRNLQHYKARAAYKPVGWMNVSGTVNILESRNNVADVFHREHNRNYGFSVTANPRERYGLEFGYNYNDVFSTTNVCFVFGFVPPPGSTLCGAAPFIEGISTYSNKVNFGYTNIMFKPMKRVTANLGYNLISTSGNTLILNPTQATLGPLALNYHKPSALLEIELAKGWEFKTAWGYYGYNEKSAPGTVAARDFHANTAMLSLRYSF